MPNQTVGLEPDRRKELEENKKYIETEGLDKLVDFTENLDLKIGVFDNASGDLNVSYPPEASDLVRLHKLIRKRKCFTVLEFGLGYSTLIMADALSKNKKEWEALDPVPEVRNRFMFQIFSVDASAEWIDVVKKRVPSALADRINISQSDVKIGTHNGQICSFYEKLPDIVADFIYLDAPHPKDVKGDINGLSFKCDERTVMSGDLLLMEPTFLPGTLVLVDGRSNNARFLQRNFTRDYKIDWNKKEDVTTFELDEERLGYLNVLGSDFL